MTPTQGTSPQSHSKVDVNSVAVELEASIQVHTINILTTLSSAAVIVKVNDISFLTATNTEN